MCKRDIIDAAWLNALGYEYRIQEEDAWLFPIGAQTGPKLADSKHDLAVGAAVNFFCSDDSRRPRVDEWDADTGDGVISGYCTQGGVMSISMNPAGEEEEEEREQGKKADIQLHARRYLKQRKIS